MMIFYVSLFVGSVTIPFYLEGHMAVVLSYKSYRKSLSASFQPIECDSKRIVAIEMKSEEIMNIFINVCMPCEDND